MSGRKLVSIIMSDYNTDINLLRNSIKSLLNQTYKHIEIIIIDDGSNNNVQEIAKEYGDRRIKVYRNKKNKGLVYSLNKAVSLAHGRYIARMDTDDISFPDRIEKQVRFMEKNPSIDVVGASAIYYDEKGEYGTIKIKTGIITKKDILAGTPMIHPSILAKSEVLKNNKYPNYNRCEDYALWIRLYLKGFRLCNMSRPLLMYHLSKDDYAKRTLKSKKGLLKLISTDYKSLKPSYGQLLKIRLKVIIASIVPPFIMYKYHHWRTKQ